MSRVYFHSENGKLDEDKDTVSLWGGERAYAAGIVNDLFQSALGISDYDKDVFERWSPILPDDCYLRHREHEQWGDWGKYLKIWLSLNDSDFVIDGKRIGIFGVALNSAQIMGSDPVRLLARIHGQCEIHGYVEGANRAWLAGIMEQGRQIGIYRDDGRWDSIITLLRERDDEPVVMSYSVCEQFPNGHIAGWLDAHDGDDWYDLPLTERWAMALKALREKDSGLELKPDYWDNYVYDPKDWNGFKVKEYVNKKYAEVYPDER